MTERQRKRAFACAVLAVCATWVLVSQLPQPATPRDEARPAATRPVTTAAGVAGTRPRATIVGAPQAPPDRSSEDAAGPALGRLVSARAAARARALAFMRALLRYEAGDVSPRVRAAIRRHADPRLAATLLAHPPRRPRGGRLPAARRIASFESLEPSAHGGFEAIALVARGSHRDPLVVTVMRARGRWAVVAVS